ncbi:MAG: MEKHLA domain-containing protein [Candidatus Sphingomonas phytovorans]|nr:MEKHLA domain-containing protein [Sphingomonas sp.]WEK01561.1 MAG: MEKHLA domain-containing protein [Sphingomonas sp.]
MKTTHLLADLSFDCDFFDLVVGSYARLVGTPLNLENQGPDWLYDHAPFALLAHNMEVDPRFIYANRTAQACFEYHWDEFVTLPSRLSAEAPDRAARQHLLDEVSRKGFVVDYAGIRVAKSGRRFQIENGIIWQLIDETGDRHGQAAVFSAWRDI